MKLFDITLPVSDKLVVWPGDPSVSIKRALTMNEGAACNVSSVAMGVHTGTHIDAPFHFLKDGFTTDKIAPEKLVGNCVVLEFGDDVESIQKKDLVNYDLTPYSKVLFKTKNSKLWQNPNHNFDKNFVSLLNCGAQYLVEQKIELVGIDYLSIEAFSSTNHEVHNTLLKSEMVILEGLNLASVPAGEYELWCLPLKLENCDGAPARVLLRQYD